MGITEMVKKLGLNTITEGEEFLIKNGIVCDLLSMVMSMDKENTVWITVQKHINVLAVALLKDIKAVIITHGIKPEEDLIEKAKKEKIWILSTKKDSFDIAGEIYGLLNHGDES